MKTEPNLKVATVFRGRQRTRHDHAPLARAIGVLVLEGIRRDVGLAKRVITAVASAVSTLGALAVVACGSSPAAARRCRPFEQRQARWRCTARWKAAS